MSAGKEPFMSEYQVNAALARAMAVGLIPVHADPDTHARYAEQMRDVLRAADAAAQEEHLLAGSESRTKPVPGQPPSKQSPLGNPLTTERIDQIAKHAGLDAPKRSTLYAFVEALFNEEGLPVVIPVGWRLVPEVPTFWMLNAAFAGKVMPQSSASYARIEQQKINEYIAMLAEVPAPPCPVLYPLAIPRTPQAVIDFIGSQFSMREEADEKGTPLPLENVVFTLTVHDLMSAFSFSGFYDHAPGGEEAPAED